MSPTMLQRLHAARNFPATTCAASRHAAQIGEALISAGVYRSLADEPAYCGESIVCTVAALWAARDEIERLRRQLAGADAFAASVNEALNSGDGSYRP